MSFDLNDVSNSPAFHVLDDLGAQGKLSASQVLMYKQQFSKLNEHVTMMHKREKQQLQKVKQLQQEVLAERIAVEKLSIKRVEDTQLLADLSKQKEQAEREKQAAGDKEKEAMYELKKQEDEIQALNLDLEHMRGENEALVRPALNGVKSEVETLRAEMNRLAKAKSVALERKNAQEARLAELAGTEKRVQAQLVEAGQELSDVTGEPRRARKSIAMVQRAVEAVREEEERLRLGLQAAEGDVSLNAKDLKEVEDALGEKQAHLQSLLKRSTKMQRDISAFEAQLESLTAAEVDLRRSRVAVDMDWREAKERLTSETQLLVETSKLFEVAKRGLKREEKAASFTRDALPELEGTVVECRHRHKSFRAEHEGMRRTLAGLRREVDALAAGYILKETLEKDQRDKLRESLDTRASLEGTLEKWKVEERMLAQTVAAKTTARERQARAAAKEVKRERDTRDQISLRRLTILDLTKKAHETANKLKEFYALYEVVKNERNKYVNLIQLANQALAEMREKTKILKSEVGILQSESAAKAQALQKEMLATATAVTQRNSLRNDANRMHAVYRQRQERLEQQIVEVDKLNAVINRLESEMLLLKRSYEHAVDTRNYTGVQLIDRNDELCILFEKANVQEATLRQGTIHAEARLQEARMLRITVGELQRQLEATRRLMPEMPEAAERVLVLQQELAAAKEETDKRCRELESPQNLSRWRPLEGEDPSEEQLVAKVTVLQGRLKEAKEGLVEKELVLEEVEALASKLRQQATAGRDDTLSLAHRVNTYQAKIRSVTRKLMSVIAELSLHQATAMRLREERDSGAARVETAEANMAQGEPPSEDAEVEFYRSEQARAIREVDAERRMANPSARDLAAMQPMQVTRTTAQPRPTAYIADELGIPRPYGAQAPFKPSDAGAQMRHFRAPREQPVVV